MTTTKIQVGEDTIELTLLETPSTNVRGSVGAELYFGKRKKFRLHAWLLTTKPAEISVTGPQRLPIEVSERIVRLLAEFNRVVKEADLPSFE